MDERAYKRERIRQIRLERLGSNNPQCSLCDESDLRCLELHHVASHKFGDDRVIVCRNCHRKLSALQKEHPETTKDKTPAMAECMGRLLLGIADCLGLLKAPEAIVSLVRQCGVKLIEDQHLFGDATGEARP